MNYFIYANSLLSDNIFWFCAISGSLMFLVQLVLHLFGGLNYDDFAPGDISDDSSFKWLSTQTITGFLMMFGWSGLTCQKEFGLSLYPTILFSITSAVLALAIMGFLLKNAKKLQSPGSVYNLDEAIGKEAYVYHRIPKNGVGKISISLEQGTFEIEAITANHEELPSFTRVQIIKKIDDKTVVVTTL